MIIRIICLFLVANVVLADFAGDIDGDGAATAIDLVRLSNHLSQTSTLPAERIRFADVDQDGLISDADRLALADVIIGHRRILELGVIPTAIAVSATNQPSVTVTGHATPGSQVEIRGGASPATGTSAADGAYSIDVPLLPNQPNRLYVATPTSAPRTLRVVHDDQAPSLTIANPGATTPFASIDVLGRVDDATATTVQVEGQDADLAHDTFVFADFAIPLGASTITITATDAAGNSTTLPLAIERLPAEGALVVLNHDPPTVQIPWPNKLVTFRLTSGDGSVNGARIHQVFSDAFGVASAHFVPGLEAGRGNHRLEASSVDVPGTAIFHASADPGAAILLHVDSGDRQIAEAGAPTPRPLRVRASDGRYGIPGVPVTFTAIHGDFAGADSATVLTDATGHAEVIHTLAHAPGNQIVEATFAGNQLPPVSFVNEAITRDQVATSLRGFVHDTVFSPLPFATCELRIGDTTLSMHSSSEGAFHFDNIAGSGLATLTISLFGYTSFTTNLVLTANADNRVPDGIRLTRVIDQVLFDNSGKATLRIHDFGGLRFTVAADSLANAPRILSLDAVPADELPAPLPDGARAPIAWFLGPEDATFDPPIAFELPNVSGLVPGSAVHILGYNSAIGEFHPVARGTVSDDGDRIRSAPGNGLRQGGWGAYCPPFPAHGAATTCSVDCGDPINLVGGSLTTPTQAFVGNELVLDLQVPIDPGQEAILYCGAAEHALPLAPQAVTTRIEVYRDGQFQYNASDSVVPDAPGSYSLELVAELRGPCPKVMRIARPVQVFDSCPITSCITPATLTGSPSTERTATVLPLSNGAVSLGFALRSPQTLEGGEIAYNCGGQTITRSPGSRPVPYTWQILRRHDDAAIATGSGTVAGATVDTPGCYYAVFTAAPGECVSAGPTSFESAETSVIDASLSIDAPVVCIGDSLSGSLELSAPPCEGALQLLVSGGAELLSSDADSFAVRGVAPGEASVALKIDGTTFAEVTFTVYAIALPSDFALCVNQEATLPISIQPQSIATAFANSALPLSVVSGSGDAALRSGITLAQELEVTLGGLGQGGVIIRGLAAGDCQLVTPCGSTTFTVAQIAISGADICSGQSAEFALSMNTDLPVTLQLRTDFGQGSAQFADSASNELQLSAAGSFSIDGLSTSSDPQNLILEAFLDSSTEPCASYRFTVAEFAFADAPLKLCVGNELPVAYNVTPVGFSGNVSLRSSDPAKALISGALVRGVSGSDSIDDTQIILALDGIDCASRALTVIEIVAPEEVKLCLGQGKTVAFTAKPADAACSLTAQLNQAGVTFSDGSREQVLDLASLDALGIALAASAPSASRNDSRLTFIGPNGERSGSVGLTVLDISFSDPGSICIGVPGSVQVSAKPPLPDLNVALNLSGPGLAGFANSATNQTISMAELDGQPLQIQGFGASTTCDDMSITATTEVGICASAAFTVVDISFDIDDDGLICVGDSRTIGISANPADPECLVTLTLSDGSRASFDGGATSIQKSLGELDAAGITVHGLSASAAAGDIDLAIDVGGGNSCYHKSLSIIDLQFAAGEHVFCAGQQANIGVVALPDVADISVPVAVTGGLSLVGDASRTLASLNASGIEVAGSIGSIELGCASLTPTVLDLAFPAPALKVCRGGSLDLAISANPASASINATLRISDGTRAQFADGSTEITDSLANLAAGVEIQGLATSDDAGDIGLSLEVNGVECASATLTVIEITFAIEDFDICLGEGLNVGVTAVPSVSECEVTLRTTGSGGATIDGNASRVYNLADLNLLGVAIQATALGSLTLVIDDAGSGCSSAPFTVSDCEP